VYVHGDPTQIIVSVDPGSDADVEERAEAALSLRADLANLDVESVQFAGGGASQETGAKSGDPVSWGTLVVAVVSSGALTALIATVNGWLGRQQGGSVTVKIGEDELVLTGASSEDQRRVVDDWLARRGTRGAGDG
jgi:Effector Associated Constant Component 1